MKEQITQYEQQSIGIMDRLRNKWATLLAIGTTAGILVSPTIHEQPAYADAPQAVVGMPFDGQWAYNANVNPPYTDANSSHPSVHAAYGFNWATDLYAAAGTEVKVFGASPQGTVTFQRNGTSDTCSSYGANIAGKGVTFNVLVNNAKVGEVKYDHLDLEDVGSNPIGSGTGIGKVTSEPLHPSCFQTRHTHVQFKNTAGNYSCYADHGNPGVTMHAGDSLGVLGSTSTGEKQACTQIPNGSSNGSSPSPVNAQEVTDGNNVYTSVGGSYWYIKPKSQWTATDTTHWGNAPITVSTTEIHNHEAGYDQNGRVVGAHPPVDGTVAYVDGGNGQQYYFVNGNAYPITVGELDDLSARGRAQPIPATGNRLGDFIGRTLNLSNGSLYRLASTLDVKQVINEAIGTAAYNVSNYGVAECLRLTQGQVARVIPQSARPYMFVNETGRPAACRFPSGWIIQGPGGVEQWRIEGDNASSPYVRRQYLNDITAYLHTSGNPTFAYFNNAGALNSIQVGPNMVLPEGAVFVNDGNGDEFKIENGVFRKVPWPDMNSCLGIVPGQIIHVPGNKVGAINQGAPMACTYSNRVLAYNGGTYYIDARGQSHKIPNAAIQNCIVARRGTGPVADVGSDPAAAYPASSEAYCPYALQPGLNFIEMPDGTVFLVGTDPDGTPWKRHVGRACVNDPETTSLRNYRFNHVPAGEDGGRWLRSDFYGDFGPVCDTLPK